MASCRARLGLVVLGREHEPRGVHVETVHDAGAVLALQRTEVVDAAVGDQRVGQGVRRVSRRGVAHQPALLRQHDEVVVLVTDVERDALWHEGHGGRLRASSGSVGLDAGPPRKDACFLDVRRPRRLRAPSPASTSLDARRSGSQRRRELTRGTRRAAPRRPPFRPARDTCGSRIPPRPVARPALGGLPLVGGLAPPRAASSARQNSTNATTAPQVMAMSATLKTGKSTKVVTEEVGHGARARARSIMLPTPPPATAPRRDREGGADGRPQDDVGRAGAGDERRERAATNSHAPPSPIPNAAPRFSTRLQVHHARDERHGTLPASSRRISGLRRLVDRDDNDASAAKNRAMRLPQARGCAPPGTAPRRATPRRRPGRRGSGAHRPSAPSSRMFQHRGHLSPGGDRNRRTRPRRRRRPTARPRRRCTARPCRRRGRREGRGDLARRAHRYGRLLALADQLGVARLFERLRHDVAHGDRGVPTPGISPFASSDAHRRAVPVEQRGEAAGRQRIDAGR